MMRINKEEKLKKHIQDWIESEIKRGNKNPDLKKFPKSSMVYSSYTAYEKHRTDLYNEYQTNPDKFRLKTKIWNKVHPDRQKVWNRKNRIKNKEANKEYLKNYRRDPKIRPRLLEKKKEYHKKLKKINSHLLEKWRVNAKIRYDDMKWKVLVHYSPQGSTEPKCSCQNCPEVLPFFMSIDHINGGGSKHRKETGWGRAYWKWFESNNFPEGFRTMCFNCNSVRDMMPDKKCPHELIGNDPKT